MQTVKEILQHLNKISNSEIVAFKKNKYAITTTNALGITMKDLNEFAKIIPYNKALALELYETKIYEAKILCAIKLKPTDVTFTLAKKWIADFDNWEICDTFCMKLIAKSSIALQVIDYYKNDNAAFKKRAAFAIIAAYTSHKTAENSIFQGFLPLLIDASNDERNFVKKAVNWALRSIGKRNIDLKLDAINTANIILQFKNKTAQWIAKDALKELHLPTVRVSDYPRHIYRP